MQKLAPEKEKKKLKKVELMEELEGRRYYNDGSIEEAEVTWQQTQEATNPYDSESETDSESELAAEPETVIKSCK